MKKKQAVISNRLISAKYKLNIHETKIILFLISTINKTDSDFWTYRTNLKDLNIHKQYIKPAIKGLLTKIIEIKSPDAEFFNWLSYAKIKGQTVEYRFDKALKPYLLLLKQNFTTIEIQTILRLSSTYYIKLYTLLKQYKSIGQREITFDELRNYLQIPKSYLNGNIVKRIIEPFTKEINQSNDILINYRIKKKGKRYNSIVFKISGCSLNDFIAKLRQHPNISLVATKDKDTNEDIILSISEEGHLYNMLDPDYRISKEKSLRIYKNLYKRKEEILDNL